MRLTRKKAIELSIALWTWIVDNPGKEKKDWPGWGKYGEMAGDCPLCEYSVRHETLLGTHCICPLNDKCGSCFTTSYGEWLRRSGRGKTKAAVEFLAQLKDLK